MPVRNAFPYLDAAIGSILSQSHRDFEFVIRDDDSSDGSRERLRFWAAKDKRIRLFEGSECLGPAGSSNFVVEQARAPIVARMDADDISHPDRLGRQLEILRRSDEVVLVGSVWEGIDRTGRIVREPDLRALRHGVFAAPFTHGSILFRRDSFDQAGGYRAECDFWEDLDLCLRMASVGRVLISTEPLYQYRFSDTSTRLTSARARVEQAVDLMFDCRARYLEGEDYSPLLAASHFRRADGRTNPNTLLSLAFTTLWSGLRPQTLGPLLSRGRLGFDRPTAQALVWALWAETSPRSLRFVMRRLLHRRNGRAREWLDGAGVCEWRPHRLAITQATEPASRAAAYA
jgi:hypothetical protein